MRTRSKRDIIALFLAILAVHMYIIGLTTGFINLFVISAIDSITAFILGIVTKSNYGHGGAVIGILIFLTSLFSLLT
ncbi:hypothetical protein FHS18_003799 [Paenibacillus phyllosphaerae]|uniref:Uncharacterized protein n=1 Tax=Paenibacillus phyllosphaerae TaxID=274593 RepID=A0A7W5FNW0_9BACL|nr:hypothetical protein [Paenibacillus phyllosphaerae]MBB3111731.1 hypothetical protein [Paenibacillus phyllosphaerae]